MLVLAVHSKHICDVLTISNYCYMLALLFSVCSLLCCVWEKVFWSNFVSLIQRVSYWWLCSPWIQPLQGCKQVLLESLKGYWKHLQKAHGVMHLMALAFPWCWPQTLQFRYFSSSRSTMKQTSWKHLGLVRFKQSRCLCSFF